MTPAPDKPIRAALYARVSTDDKGQDVENQLAPMRAYCAAQGYQVAGEYVDRLSGASKKRPQFLLMFAAARIRHVDIVLFWSLDRLSREGVSATLAHLEMLESYRVAWRSYTEQYLDSCGVFKDAVLAILAVIAKQERIRLQERTIAGLVRARAAGKTLGRPRIVVDRLKIAEMQAAGMGLRAIAKALDTSVGTVARAARDARAAEAC